MKAIVVGLGSMGKRRIRLLQKFSQIEQILGVDSREDRRVEVEEKFGCPTFTSIADAAAQCSEGDCSLVCTSPLSHNAIIRELLSHKLHVFTEINLVADGYEENMQRADDSDRVLFLSSTFFYREEVKYIREKIQGKRDLNYIYHIGQYLPDWHPWESYKDYFIGDKRTNGCREIMAIDFPWLVDTFGDVKQMHVISDKITQLHIDYKDNYMIQFVHENGIKGCVIVDIVSPKAGRSLEIYGENLHIGWDGTATGLTWFDPEEKVVKPVNLYETIDQQAGYRAMIVENAYEEEIRQYLAAIEGTSVPPYGFADDLKVLKLIDEIEGI